MAGWVRSKSPLRWNKRASTYVSTYSRDKQLLFSISFTVYVHLYLRRTELLKVKNWGKKKGKKAKVYRYIPGVAQGVGRGIALLFHDRGARRGWVVSSTPRPHFIPGKEPVPIVQEAGWAPGPVWTGGKSRPHRDSIPDHLVQLYRLIYPAHKRTEMT